MTNKEILKMLENKDLLEINLNSVYCWRVNIDSIIYYGISVDKRNIMTSNNYNQFAQDIPNVERCDKVPMKVYVHKTDFEKATNEIRV